MSVAQVPGNWRFCADGPSTRRQPLWSMLGCVAWLLVTVLSTAVAADEPLGGRASDSGTDERPRFEAHAYVGYAIDSFAGTATKTYLNPEASGDLAERWVAGFDFAYCLNGDPDSSKPQVWIYGRTMHGVRSTDVDCKQTPDLPVCKEYGSDFGEQHLFILRNARTLEGFLAARLELGALPGHTDAARVYLKAQAGFVAVASAGGDAVDMHHVGLGIVAVSGSLQDSFIEVGYGRNDLFATNPRRWKIAGFLTWSRSRLGVAPFAALLVDTDIGRGADSIQSCVGLSIRLEKFSLFKLLSGAGK